MAALAALALSVGCRDATATAKPALCGEDDDRNISVTGSVAPSLNFDWKARESLKPCGITLLTVLEGEGSVGKVMWSFEVPWQQSAVGPIAYGATPQSATFSNAPLPLEVGKRYTVFAWLLIGGDVVGATGSLTFTYFPAD